VCPALAFRINLRNAAKPFKVSQVKCSGIRATYLISTPRAEQAIPGACSLAKYTPVVAWTPACVLPSHEKSEVPAGSSPSTSTPTLLPRVSKIES
jgi:hypothetical protein